MWGFLRNGRPQDGTVVSSDENKKLSGKSLQERQNVLVNFRLADLLFSIHLSRHVVAVTTWFRYTHLVYFFENSYNISPFARQQSFKFLLPVIKVTSYLSWEEM